MSNQEYIIREIEQKDNPQLALVVRNVILEMGAPTVGTAYEDKATDQLYETYQKEKAIYFVLEYQNKVVGGAGIAQLDNFDGNVCELQKMYFLPEARGKGLGSKMISICLEKAKEFGFESCYLETLPYMKDAVKLYKKNGFKNLEKPMGNTCHYSCDVWMIKDL
ncbi:MAG: GNAT family N-acetyltransferase [Flavobacteriia bacterium]|nr:GNAT family N-acetyltransferase [Flavobacteriia bacterium]OIP47293.1 MAG: GNAT family N-acetyltransferase [Flavobacteriaceae bacterium CG2_30_31_66]PIV96125.1 MAG: GNAT family N-acetyltransferase [Flavobacteriaceae bacterium CG17_big_fil_post_rev_8_21_14_2_50_31_13]PIX13051.1 MAG: GNAT family N-acetyltransferase [Flavobacteriaceae bacterium CG_4_8_14_3_um_filter_31_8]PIY14342.1 MAG: GNAT family N-acetyltransferase [Flavobacteriaceae bacterium CG_4_10_14_3_um_filter_31_253]PIZ10429.1 MAG: GN